MVTLTLMVLAWTVAMTAQDAVVRAILPDAFWVSLAPSLTSLGGLIVAVGTLVVSLRVSRKADKIHDSTNSNLAAVTAKLDMANARIDALNQLIAYKTAAESAARAATTEALAAALTTPAVGHEAKGEPP